MGEAGGGGGNIGRWRKRKQGCMVGLKNTRAVGLGLSAAARWKRSGKAVKGPATNLRCEGVKRQSRTGSDRGCTSFVLLIGERSQSLSPRAPLTLEG
ncbi:MAG: hypothetical protein BJ554DRAFT_1734 [Olpidium bornovanus]|uniref:Uncharacterized protein n=1 Tax=Olpidium bornovanus TaxID=278681 RepID=A0A8H8DMB3_9FUNG|nr:MAG: hypothetical protein BJ554DRAFT_1734 [Olpidium bornovanus]